MWSGASRGARSWSEPGGMCANGWPKRKAHKLPDGKFLFCSAECARDAVRRVMRGHVGQK